MRIIKRSILIAPILALVALSQGCGGTQIESVFAKGVVALRAARRVTSVQYNAGHITVDQYRSRLLLFRDLNIAVDQTADEVVALGNVTPENKAQVLVKLDDLFAKIDVLIAEGHVGVRNPQSINDYRTNLMIARTVLTSLYTTIQTIKGPTPVTEMEVKQ